MRQQVPPHIKEEVIRKWLNGEQRDKIASDMSLGAGTVTNIISQWKEEIGIPTADTLRDLATELKRLNINALQCANGCRLLNIVNKLGAQETNLGSFLTQIYTLCTSKNISPELIVQVSAQLAALDETIPVSQIPEYIHQKIEEKQHLEQEVKTLKERKMSAQRECDEALRSGRITIDTLHEYAYLRDFLEKSGLSIDHDDEDNLTKLTNVIYNLKHSGYDAKTITKSLSNINSLQTREQELQCQVNKMEGRLKRTEQDYSVTERKLAYSKQTLAEYNELRNMGFGLKELKLLKSTVIEISTNNNIKPNHAVKKFFEDIKGQYDNKLGFERMLNEMNSSLLHAQRQHHNISLEYSQKKDTNDKLAELLTYGVTQDEIIYWTSILKDHKIEISSLHQDLVKYGTVIAAYNDIASKVVLLNSESNALAKKVEGLREEQRRISDVIEFQLGKCTKAIETFLHNLDNHINEVSKTSIQAIKNVKE